MTTKTPMPLYQRIHTETAYLHREQLVFEIANAITVSFNLRGDGHQLQPLFDAGGCSTDEEILLEWIVQRLMAWEQDQAHHLVTQLIDELDKALLAEGGLSCQR